MEGGLERPWIVLGGGISGLMAALELRRRGLEVEVWEASSSPGGLARTLPWPGPAGDPGFLERGPQALRVSRGGALESLLAELALEASRPGPKGPRWLGKGGRLHPGPGTMRGLVQAPGMSLGEKLRILAEPFIPPTSREDDTLHSYFARRLGEGFARELLPALVAGLFAAPPHRVGLAAVPSLRRLEARGGLILGGLKEPRERTVLPAGGTGALATALAGRLESRRPDTLTLDRRALALEPRPDGGWRVRGEDIQREAAQVVLALPSGEAGRLLAPIAPRAAADLADLVSLDLTVWHSRHPRVPGWDGGIALLIHPPEGRGLLGAVSLAYADPRGAKGLLQLRTYVGGAFPVDPALKTWPGVFAELQRWLPSLPGAVQVREEATPGAFPLPAPGHRSRAERILQELPPGIHWLGAARFGPGLKDLAEGVREWNPFRSAD